MGAVFTQFLSTELCHLIVSKAIVEEANSRIVNKDSNLALERDTADVLCIECLDIA